MRAVDFPSAQVAEDSGNEVRSLTGTQLLGSPLSFGTDQLAKRSRRCVPDYVERPKGNQSSPSNRNSGSTIKASTMLSSTSKLSLEKMKSSVYNVEGTVRILGLALLIVSWANARPATYDEYLAVENDSASVGSLRREVRQPVPLRFASEVKDLLVAGNEPKRHGKKKPIKNESGTSSFLRKGCV